MKEKPKRVRKAVLPVAGLGTRFLPATKAMPKEMLPVVDKPLIQYAVEECIGSGIENIIFVIYTVVCPNSRRRDRRLSNG
jgi:UTP--glucose-1-phosphate uridylyltransferase